MKRRWLAMAGCVLVVGLAGCSVEATNDQALANATTYIRRNANNALGQMRTSLAGGESLSDTLHDLVVNSIAPLTILRSDVQPSPSTVFTADLVFVADGEAGGADYKQAAVRMCVRFSGQIGPAGHVDMADLSCPGGLPSSERGVPIERTVDLSG